MINVSRDELAMIIASLRYTEYLHEQGGGLPAMFHDTLTDCGEIDAMDPENISDLCERINEQAALGTGQIHAQQPLFMHEVIATVRDSGDEPVIELGTNHFSAMMPYVTNKRTGASLILSPDDVLNLARLKGVIPLSMQIINAGGSEDSDD